MLWTFDRVIVPTGFTAAFIRLGNLMNHEIMEDLQLSLGVSIH